MPAHNHHRHNHGAHEGRQLREYFSHVGDALGLTINPPEKRAPRTITSVMYYTLEPTFTGSVAGYFTSSDEVEPTPTPTPTPVETPESTPKPTPTTPTTDVAKTHAAETTAEATTEATTETTEAKTKTTPKAHATTSKELSSLPSSIVPTKAVSVDTTDAVLLATETSQIGTPLSLSPSTSTPTSAPLVEDTGMSGGAKAGMAIGIILGIAAIASLIFFCFRQRKKAQEREKLDDEKFDNVAAGAAGAGAAAGMAGMAGAAGMARAGSTKTLSTAPRVDVRPTTAFFMPNRASQVQKGQGPQGNGIQMTSQPRSGLGPQSQNGANPFGNHAEAIDPVNAAGPSVVEGVSAAGVVMAAGLAGAAGAAAARGGPQDQNGPNGAAPIGAVIKGPVRSTSRGAQSKYTPNQTGNGQGPFSDAARTDGGAQNTPQQVHNTTVIPMPLAGVIEESRPSTAVGLAASAALAADAPLYRVHLDFSPSMPDELRVRAGEIVRLLKEFDDGWCMCINDDLSFEGVLPRTCISNRPIRRPQNSPPTGPNNGQFPPPGQRRNSPPNGNRSPAMNPNGRNSPGPGYGPQYRPQQQQGRPQQGRPMSPAMSANGRNSPGPGRNSGPQYRPQQAGPMSPAYGNGPPRNGPPGQARPMAPPNPPRIQTLDMSASQSVSSIAANFPLPGSPGSPPPPQSPMSPTTPAQRRLSGVDVAERGIPEVTITAPVEQPVEQPAERPLERKPVGRKPLPDAAAVLPGQAQ